MNSLMSILISASSVPNMNSASAFANSVFPTPVGPRKRKLPIGRFGSLRPARARRTARLSVPIACSWPTTRPPSDSSIFRRRAVSASARRITGIPVHIATTAATSSSVTAGRSSARFAGCRFGLSAATALLTAGAEVGVLRVALAEPPSVRDAASMIGAGRAAAVVSPLTVASGLAAGAPLAAAIAGVGVVSSALGAVAPVRLARQARSSSVILPLSPSSWLRSEPARSNAPAAAASC